MKISVAIITYNEERNIARCLESLGEVADEIVVLDSFSTDRTEEICENHDVKFFTNPFEGHIQQKNHALSLVTHDWVLSLDADEALSGELQTRILQLKKNGPTVDGYIFNRLTNYCGKWINHGGWYPDKKMRLWNKNQGRWGGQNPHDRVEMDENTKTMVINEDILHYSYYSVDQHIDQINKFSSIAAKEMSRRQKRVVLVFHLLIYPFLTFVRNYFFKLGILDGYSGFILAINGSFYKFQKYTKLFLLKKNNYAKASDELLQS